MDSEGLDNKASSVDSDSSSSNNNNPIWAFRVILEVCDQGSVSSLSRVLPERQANKNPGLGGAIGVSQPPLSNTGTPGAELAGLLSPGRTQVFANQKFGVSQRMMVQVSEGQIVCEVGNSQTMLRMGQMYKFRGGQREVCLAQQPSIVLSEAY